MQLTINDFRYTPTKERLQYRNLDYNTFHRFLGKKTYSTDLDFVEANGDQPVAVVETKYSFDLSVAHIYDGFQISLLRNIADKLEVPLVVLEYNPDDFSKFRIYPMNYTYCKKYFGDCASRIISLIDWIKFQYEIRYGSVTVIDPDGITDYLLKQYSLNKK